MGAPAKNNAKAKESRPALAQLEAAGIDRVCEMIRNGELMSEIAASLGVSKSSLTEWIQADGERSARARASRALTAQHWDEKAEAEIARATDPFEISRAKELAHHYRWRASKIAPTEYGEKIGVEHSGTVQLADALEAARKRVKGDE